MKSRDLLDAMNGIDFEMVENAAEPGRRQTSRISRPLRWGAAAACFCAALTGLLAVFPQFYSGLTHAPSAENGLYWVDDRPRNTDKQTLSPNLLPIWRWDCRSINDQFSSVEWSGTSYSARTGATGQSISAELVGEKLGSASVKGYDSYENKEYTAECGIYAIRGVDPGRFIAVRFADHDEYYSYCRSSEEFCPPQTLGELIDGLDLTKNCDLTLFSYRPSGQNSLEAERHGLSRQDSDELWEIFLRYADAQTVADEDERRALIQETDWRLQFFVSSEALGADHRSWTLRTNDSGSAYLESGIEYYSYYYEIGAEAAETIVEYVLSHQTDENLEPEEQWLCGIITEIGEDYIKIDDSVLMKDPDDGIEFTVYANDLRVRQYITGGLLHVGDTVAVMHRGIYAEEPTVVRTAFEIGEAVITDSGEVLVPD